MTQGTSHSKHTGEDRGRYAVKEEEDQAVRLVRLKQEVIRDKGER